MLQCEHCGAVQFSLLQCVVDAQIFTAFGNCSRSLLLAVLLQLALQWDTVLCGGVVFDLCCSELQCVADTQILLLSATAAASCSR